MSTQLKIGLGRRKITPTEPMYLAGFAARTRPFEGVLHELWTKAMAIEDGAGGRVVLASVEVIFVTTAICDAVAARVFASHGVPREALVFNVTHTHGGPMVESAFARLSGLDAEHTRRVASYTERLVGLMAEAIGEALEATEPAELWFGRESAPFAVNRRMVTAEGVIGGANPEGPHDHEVPVLKVTAPDGTLRAVAFGYACHTTSITSQHYQLNGDYAGYAQMGLDAAHPGAEAFFFMLCGADQNALPRGTLEQSRAYGATLAGAVGRALEREMKPLTGPVSAVLRITRLPLAAPTREMFEERMGEDHAANRWVWRHAELMLDQYAAGAPVHSVDYPIQVVRFGDDMALFLGGEPVVDYGLQIKAAHGERLLFVAGYSNDVMAYIPTLRVLREGGYEGGESMIYFGLPAAFDESVERRVLGAVDDVMGSTGMKGMEGMG